LTQFRSARALRAPRHARCSPLLEHTLQTARVEFHARTPEMRGRHPSCHFADRAVKAKVERSRRQPAQSGDEAPQRARPKTRSTDDDRDAGQTRRVALRHLEKLRADVGFWKPRPIGDDMNARAPFGMRNRCCADDLGQTFDSDSCGLRLPHRDRNVLPRAKEKRAGLGVVHDRFARREVRWPPPIGARFRSKRGKPSGRGGLRSRRRQRRTTGRKCRPGLQRQAVFKCYGIVR
jgi:hypothetical protein